MGPAAGFIDKCVHELLRAMDESLKVNTEACPTLNSVNAFEKPNKSFTNDWAPVLVADVCAWVRAPEFVHTNMLRHAPATTSLEILGIHPDGTPAEICNRSMCGPPASRDRRGSKGGTPFRTSVRL